MNDDVVLKVENLSKCFKIYPNPKLRIKEWMTFGKRSYHNDFWALKNISFEVHRGGFLGIIGPNGAGKSTLLKVVTGTLVPTSGSYESKGVVLSLLELSSGMDDELTGRENILRSAELLGFPDGYINEQLSQIEGFAELDDFFDRKLKLYSSGMRIRLAFSMFAFLKCDLLILDEVLAVGDIFFRQKCYKRLEELMEQNTAIVLVTHGTGIVRQYCDDVIVLSKGTILYHGKADNAISRYFQIKRDQGITLTASDTFVEEDYVLAEELENNGEDFSWPSEKIFALTPVSKFPHSDFAELTHLAVCDENGKPRQTFMQGETVYFFISYRIKEKVGIPVAGIHLTSVTNLVISSKSSIEYHDPLHIMRPGDRVRYKQTIKLEIAPGNYIFNLTLHAIRPSDYSRIDSMTTVEYKENLVPILGIKSAGEIEIIDSTQSRDINAALCNLEGESNLQIFSDELI